ncbi:bifunctional diaminohydroxyphosphoribosylaminopyrimidine deaminase/5-amino-6-(5-phosphoribosylamino)uracil reductase RibD [Peptoniphilus obesi]|uniref:bifunctional diaminohydroxyphosphoribosylaminopyrimidine deaminase/5-amino-6-(5-phosphoribosylamino)uracil reductase RibD n=1 Tax=Peptoniphilus obesi TaxID=1472765 RepID=UPI0004B77326|nr:bifunctional diaminohydroxyphosphoribosylaminopyrimidine deaminase/5-amino-6-(5-phosphoribosylamino)uracil reductase RibD [Peptoniphilus obesi]
MKDEKYMKLCLELAKKATGYVSPNPLVGAVIVKDGEIISTGYHKKYGDLHAEVDAINNAKEDLEGTTMYVNLEPCSHYGSQPPCVKKIIEAKIKRVVIGVKDPNPLVAGRGIKELTDHGIEVRVGVLEDECLELNKIFFYFITKNLPYVAMKFAMSLDGKIATSTGDSKWISGEFSRRHVHKLRLKYSAIMVGIGTVLADNPMLDCRLPNETKNPIRVICDSNLRTPLDSKIANSAHRVKTIIATSRDNENSDKIAAYKEKGIEFIFLGNSGLGIDIHELFVELGKRKIDSVFVEGGGTLNSSVMQTGLLNKVYVYMAPILIGGKDAKSPICGLGIPYLKDAIKLKDLSVTNIGSDFLIEGEV